MHQPNMEADKFNNGLSMSMLDWTFPDLFSSPLPLPVEELSLPGLGPLDVPSPSPQRSSSSKRKKPRTKVTKACTNCFRAKSGCDNNRPCSRCVRLKLPDCVDRIHKKRGKKPKQRALSPKRSRSSSPSSSEPSNAIAVHPLKSTDPVELLSQLNLPVPLGWKEAVQARAMGAHVAYCNLVARYITVSTECFLESYPVLVLNDPGLSVLCEHAHVSHFSYREVNGKLLADDQMAGYYKVLHKWMRGVFTKRLPPRIPYSSPLPPPGTLSTPLTVSTPPVPLPPLASPEGLHQLVHALPTPEMEELAAHFDIDLDTAPFGVVRMRWISHQDPCEFWIHCESNDNACRLLGRTRRNIANLMGSGDSLGIFFHPDEWVSMMRVINTMTTSNNSYSDVHRVVRGDGSCVRMLFSMRWFACEKEVRGTKMCHYPVALTLAFTPLPSC